MSVLTHSNNGEVFYNGILYFAKCGFLSLFHAFEGKFTLLQIIKAFERVCHPINNHMLSTNELEQTTHELDSTSTVLFMNNVGHIIPTNDLINVRNGRYCGCILRIVHTSLIGHFEALVNQNYPIDSELSDIETIEYARANGYNIKFVSSSII